MAFSALGPYESSTVASPHTVVVKFKRPFAPFLSSVAQSVLAPVSPDAVRKHGKDFGTRPVGTGPFKFASYTTDSVLRLVRNPDYRWGPSLFKHPGPPYLDAVSWRIIPEASTRLAALRAGEVHVIQDVPTQEYRNVQREASIQLLQGDLAGSVEHDDQRHAAARRRHPGPAGPPVGGRQGRDGPGRLAGVHKPACSPITSTMFGFDPATCNVYRYDPKKAGDLLDEAGWKMGPGGVRRKDGQDLALALYYRSDNPDFAAMATFLQSMYQQIGIKIDLNGLAQAGTSTPCGPASTTSSSGGTPAPIPTWSASSSTRRTPTGDEPQRYKNAEMDTLIDEAAGSSDPAKRKRSTPRSR